MASSIDKIVDEIVNDSISTANDVIAVMAKLIETDWEIEVKKALDYYYNDHITRNRYKNKRTRSLYNDLVVPVCLKSNSGYTAGVLLSPGLMYHSPLTQFNEDGIFENFMTGMHGNIPYTMPKTGQQIERNIKKTSPDAQTILDNYYKNYNKKLDEFYEIAKKICV